MFLNNFKSTIISHFYSLLIRQVYKFFNCHCKFLDIIFLYNKSRYAIFY